MEPWPALGVKQGATFIIRWHPESPSQKNIFEGGAPVWPFDPECFNKGKGAISKFKKKKKKDTISAFVSI